MYWMDGLHLGTEPSQTVLAGSSITSLGVAFETDSQGWTEYIFPAAFAVQQIVVCDGFFYPLTAPSFLTTTATDFNLTIGCQTAFNGAPGTDTRQVYSSE